MISGICGLPELAYLTSIRTQNADMRTQAALTRAQIANTLNA
jgi:hypothetical protein